MFDVTKFTTPALSKYSSQETSVSPFLSNNNDINSMQMYSRHRRRRRREIFNDASSCYSSDHDKDENEDEIDVTAKHAFVEDEASILSHLSMDKSEYSILNCTTLSDEHIQTVVSSFNGDYSDVLTNDDSICKVTRRDFICLKDRKWLNDLIIHSYLMLLQEYVTTKRIRNVHVFDPYFWSLLLKNPYSEMKVWTKSRTKNVYIFELDILYIPINIGNYHWASIAVFFKESRIVYYDSLLVEDKVATERMDYIFRYLTEEWEENHEYFGLSQSTKPIRNQWIFKVATVPKQTNRYDCGVYVCAFAQCVLFDTNVNTVTPSVITKMRYHIGISILHGRLLPDPFQSRSIAAKKTMKKRLVLGAMSLSTKHAETIHNARVFDNDDADGDDTKSADAISSYIKRTSALDEILGSLSLSLSLFLSLSLSLFILNDFT
jgi:Ulp1 family protease